MVDSKSDPVVRELIGLIFITDSDLDAFCQDYFPKIKKRFTDGMDRVRKVNLLLELGDANKVLKVLQDKFPKEMQKHADLPGVPSIEVAFGDVTSIIRPPVKAPPAKRPRIIRLALAATILACIIGASLGLLSLRSIPRPAEPTPLLPPVPVKPVPIGSPALDPCPNQGDCFHGTDALGHDATYKALRIDALDLGYSWVFGCSDHTYYKGASTEIGDYFNDNNIVIQRLIRDGKYGLITIGSASQEGDVSEEASRAGDRANELRRQLLSVIHKFNETPISYPVYTLNLGKCNGSRRIETCAIDSLSTESPLIRGADTKCQRAVILIAIVKEDSGVNHEQALKDAMRSQEGKDQFPYDFETDFDLFMLRKGPAQY